MQTSVPTQWTIPLGPPCQLRTGLLGGNRYIAELCIGTDGPITEIDARIHALGANDALQRLRERMTGDVKIARYQRLRAEAVGIDQQSHGLQATVGRLYAERAEVIALAAPGFASKVAALDKQAASVEERIAQAKVEADAIRSEVSRAREDALRAMQRPAGDVQTQIAAELKVHRETVVEQVRLALSPLLTELSAIERAVLAAAGGSLVGDLGRLLEELAAAAKVETPEHAA